MLLFNVEYHCAVHNRPTAGPRIHRYFLPRWPKGECSSYTWMFTQEDGYCIPLYTIKILICCTKQLCQMYLSHNLKDFKTGLNLYKNNFNILVKFGWKLENLKHLPYFQPKFQSNTFIKIQLIIVCYFCNDQ